MNPLIRIFGKSCGNSHDVKVRNMFYDDYVSKMVDCFQGVYEEHHMKGGYAWLN
jgi:hypothetical protein